MWVETVKFDVWIFGRWYRQSKEAVGMIRVDHIGDYPVEILVQIWGFDIIAGSGII